ncbi:hypothetical protein COE51_23405 [Bacillus pseudomycoides]|nr:hypothetical protein COE51_23405 [Bacillus pseudomycoides]
MGECEERICVFEHTKRKDVYDSIKTLKEFTVQCQFIEGRNTHWYWHKGKNVKEMTMEEFEERIREEQKELKSISKEEFIKVRNRYAPFIKPIEFPSDGIRFSYAYEPEWNDVFFVMETEASYFAVYWFTSA